tara:strand:+ start:18813 stop:19070 length:258 start_codon:yes stop_codon:yes gene_type:complete
MNIYNAPWISRQICVVGSNDSTLVGISGVVIEESRRTILVRTESGEVTLPKDVISFTIDSEELVIDGSSVKQRPENRINRRYRRN